MATAEHPRGLMAATLGRMPILWQSLLMVTLSLLASALVSLMLTWALPMPRLDFYSMHDIAEAVRAVERGEDPADPLIRHRTAAAPPVAGDDLRSDMRMTRALATQLGRPITDVALVYRADQTNFPFRYRTEAGVPLRQGEAQFYNSVFAAARAGDGHWVVVETPKRPLITRFQRRSIMAFLLSVLVTLPLAYLFARQLAAPIRRFADAAERVGADNAAPAVPAEGATELRLAAEALTKMQQRINDTMAERTAMIGAIAHDLRTPLTRIAFRMEAAPAPLREAVQADIDQMRAMVEATIGFIRHGTKVGDALPVDLALIVERITVDSQAMGLPVSVAALPAGPAIIAGDAVALGRMLQNLVDNALIYAGSAEIGITIDGDCYELGVADRGPGLDPALIDEVFKPFKRGEPSRNRATGGLGLGLALARLTAGAHGGTISARNRRGGGLVVFARFPAATPPNGRPRRPRAVNLEVKATQPAG
jgi:two-component system, OmpR family, sensor kinase